MRRPNLVVASAINRMMFSVIAVLVSVIVAPDESALGQEPVTAIDISQLWEDPTNLVDRDLLAGPGGASLAPATAPYRFVAHKDSGTNPGYDVRDAAGRLWGVKLGEEAQPEVTASRILWGMGFHQPPTYYVEQWTLEGEDGGAKGASRFRPDLDTSRVISDWSWYENPFVGTQPFAGLVVAQLILGNWDLKTSNNKIYESMSPPGAPLRRYVVRDLGASLGK